MMNRGPIIPLVPIWSEYESDDECCCFSDIEFKPLLQTGLDCNPHRFLDAIGLLGSTFLRDAYQSP